MNPINSERLDRPTFAPGEYQSRLSRLHSLMEENQIDLLVLTDPANLYYVTGYEGETYYVPQVALVSPRIDQPMWIGRGMDLITAEDLTWMEPGFRAAYPESGLTDGGRGAILFIADALDAHGLARGRIGIERGSWHLAPQLCAGLAERLPEAELVDATGLVNRLRAVKSPAEVALMRDAGRIAANALDRGMDLITPGARESDAVGAMVAAQYAGVEGKAGDWCCSPVFLSAGLDGMIHRPSSDRLFQKDVPVTIELGASRRRYHAALSRTVHLGRPPEAFAALDSAVQAATAATLPLIRPGAVASDIEAHWRREMARHGYSKSVRIGYAIGIGFPPTWGERTYSIANDDHTELEAGMTFHFHLGMWGKGVNHTLSDTILVTDVGSQSLTPLDPAVRITL